METILKIYVKPRSSRSVFPSAIFDDEVEAMLKSPPDKGKANKELIELISNFFRVPKSNITIISGITSREKKIRIIGISPDNAWNRLKKSEFKNQ